MEQSNCLDLNVIVHHNRAIRAMQHGGRGVSRGVVSLQRHKFGAGDDVPGCSSCGSKRLPSSIPNKKRAKGKNNRKRKAFESKITSLTYESGEGGGSRVRQCELSYVLCLHEYSG